MIKTARTIIRPHSMTDHSAYAEMSGDPEVMKYFPNPYSKDESFNSLARFIDYQNEHGFSFWAIEMEGTYAGFCGFLRTGDTMPFPPTVEIGWRLKSEYWRQGYAFEAATACLHYGFETLKLPEIVSFTAELNVPSWSLMEKLGMLRSDDFDHPSLKSDHPLARHRLYKIKP